MQKLLAAVSFALLGLLINITSPPYAVQAAGGDLYGVKLAASPSAGKADGSSVVTVTVQAVRYRCSVQVDNSPYGPPSDRHEERPGACEAGGYGAGTEEILAGTVGVKLVVSGSGNTLSATSLTTDGNGYGSFTIKSSVAETKIIDAWYPGMGEVIGSLGLTFTAPVAAAPKAAPKAVAAAPAEVAPPVAPVAVISVDGAAVKADDKPTITHDEPLLLSGKTVPNGIVTIYVFSEPKKYTATADKDGNWSHEVSGLPPGDHHIEAEVTDPATGKTSARAQVLAFSVVKSVEPASKAAVASSPTDSKGSSSVPISLIAGGIVLLIAILLGGLWKFKRAAFDRIFRRRSDQGAPRTL